MFIPRKLAAAAVAVTLGLQAHPSAASDVLAECALAPTEIFDRNGANIVQVISIGVDPFRVAGRILPGTGSGILIRPDLVLTNYHVVQGGQLIAVDNGSAFSDALLIGGDPALDIALLEIAPSIDAKQPVEFAPMTDLAVGQTAYVLGYPLGIGKSMTSGIISGLERLIPLNTTSWTTYYIQTDAPISGGNSGGALMDVCGRIVGMVTLQSADPSAENLGYALPSDTFLPVLDEIETRGRISRPWHGLYGQMMNPLIEHLMLGATGYPPNGFLVETVEPGSAAEAAGIRGGVLPVQWGMAEVLLGGDVITAVNGRPIGTLEDALAAVSALKVGETVTMSVWREGETFETSAILPERPILDRDLLRSLGR